MWIFQKQFKSKHSEELSLKYWREKKSQPKIIYPEKNFYKWMQNKGFFPDIQKLKNLAKVDLC